MKGMQPDCLTKISLWMICNKIYFEIGCNKISFEIRCKKIYYILPQSGLQDFWDGFIILSLERGGRRMKRRIECIVCRAQVCDAALSVGAIIDFDRM